MTKNDCFFFGKITKTHGLKGELTIKLDVANPEDFKDLRYLLIEDKGNLIPYFIESQKINGDKMFVQFQDVKKMEQAVVFLWAAAGKPAPNATQTTFTDVKPKAYYYNAVLWAQENGITGGVSETSFGVKQYCSRAQIAVFLWRWFGSVEPGVRNYFQDVPSHAYYSSAVDWAVENGITSGTTPTTFSPKKYCSRAEIVTFLYAAKTKLMR